jgi:hypothetical protein|tara:strand:- start:1733 stop:2095 length:363 start_codon:yes stop_codon:yes gene_type:complete
MSYSSGRVTSATVASTSKTTVATLNCPSNETWLIYQIYGCHPQGGLVSLDIDQIPGGNFEWMQNSTTITNSGANNPHGVAINIVGPATIKTEVTNAAATSGVAKVAISYNVTQRRANGVG